MTCRFTLDVIDLARGAALEPARHQAVVAHVRDCAHCAVLLGQQRAVSRALRRMADEPLEPAASDDRRLKALLAVFDATRPRPRRMSFGIGLSLAASVLIVAGLSVGWKHDAPPNGASEVAATPAPPMNADFAFVVLPGASALPHFDHGEVIRVEVPSAGGAVQMDVLVGQDGLARAARFVQ